MSHLFIGVISGTSVDGLDLALLDVGVSPARAAAESTAESEDEPLRGSIRFIASTTIPFEPKLRSTLLDLGQPGGDDVDLLGAADVALGRAIGEAVLTFIEQQQLAPAQISAIGSHGQTVRHRPPDPGTTNPFTLQIGDPNQVTELTGIPTVADFRRRDMAAGGQGAPLVAPFHEVLFRDQTMTRGVLNIGGISNLTLLPNAADEPISGFDCGPGNALMDGWIYRERGEPYDAEGAWGATGTCNDQLLQVLLGDPYLNVRPPKSTGREYYNQRWLQQHLDANGLSTLPGPDVQATLAEFTAAACARALSNWGHHARQLVVCGGGRHNALLMSRLDALTGSTVEVMATERLGVDGDGLEAGLFAWLASRTLAGLAGNDPAVTGARGPRVLGAVFPA